MGAARALQTTKQTAPAAAAAQSAPVRSAPTHTRGVNAHVRAATPAVRLSTEASAPAPASLPAPALQAVGASGSGNPLPSGVQDRLEGSLKVSLAPVRVHTDAPAAAAAESMGARAFTYGTHIYFGAREQPSDLSLTAHEVTHVVQQQGRPVLQLCCAGKSGGGAFEAEADSVSAAVGRGEAASVEGRTSGPRVQKQDQPNVFQRGARWLGQRAGEVLEWAEDKALGLVERVAPDLMPIIRRGPAYIVDWLKERFQTALESVVNALAAPVRGITGVVASVSGHVGRLVAWMQDAYAKLSRNDCSPVAEAAAKIEQVFNEIASPVFERIKSLANSVRGFFTGVWNKFGAPAWDFLRQAGGAAWQRIQEFAGWVWEKAAPVRRLAARAWTWVKNQLGIGEGAEGQNGLLQWIERKASAAWDWVKERIEPIKRPLMLAGGVLLLLSPAGPFIAIGAGVAGLIMGVRYLRSLSTPGFIVQARAALHGRIIPAILSGVNAVTGALSRAASAITGKLDQLTGGLLSLVGAVGGSILRFAVGVVNWIAEQFRALAAWAHDKLTALVSAVRDAFNAARKFLQPVFDVLGRVIAVVANPFGIPGLLMGSAWRLIPYCFKGPLINFILRIVIRIVRAIPGNPLVGLLWPFIKAGLLGFLEKALGFDTERKVRIADRFAKLASGGSTSFVLGYLGGLVLGLWDGISGPFVMLWDIAELIGGIFSWLGRMFATITDPAVDVGRRLLASLRGAWESIKSNIIPAVQQFLSGPADPMRVINFIRDILNSIVQAAGSAGGSVFDALIGFLNQGDYELGHSLGRFAGNILFEVLLSILTAGGYAAKPVVQRLARWVTGFVGKIAKFASEIMRSFPRLVSAVESVGTFARTNPAMQRILGAVKGLLSRLAGFFMSMYGIGGAAERGAAATERAAGAAERGVGAAERAAGAAERGAGAAERAAGRAERGAGAAERGAGAAERGAGAAERGAGAAERGGGAAERGVGATERRAGSTQRVEEATQQIEHAVCGLCFAAGTKVLTREGHKNIEDVEPGDYLLALDENLTGARAYKRVLNTFRNFRDSLVEIKIGRQVINSTPGHVWYVVGKGWTLARNIEEGDEVLTSDGDSQKVSGVRAYEETGFAYNCEVEGFHTYFVAGDDGAPGIWVHNASVSVRTLRPDQVYQTILPGVVITDREAIRAVVGKSLNATGSYSTELGGLYSYLRRGGGAGHLGVSSPEARNAMEAILRNLETKGGGVMAAIDLERVGVRRVYDLANPEVMERLLERYRRFNKFFTRLEGEGVIAVRGMIPSQAVRSLVNIPPGISEAERRELIDQLVNACRRR
jgi:hypothetical protein